MLLLSYCLRKRKTYMCANRFRYYRAAGLIIFVFGAGLPSQAQEHPHYNSAELRHMMAAADTPDQLQALSTWFREEERTLRCKADAENKNYEEYRRVNAPEKLTGAESARNLRDYYSYK